MRTQRPSASLDGPKAHAAPTHPGTPPEQLGGSPWPQDRASACPKDELFGPFHPQARESKSRARVEAYESLASRVSKVAKPTGGVQLEQGKMQRLGRTVLTCDGVTVEVGGRQILA